MIATHSLIIMAYPRSRIALLLNDSIEEVQYTETDHYLTTKSFVNDHVNMLKRLLEEMCSNPGLKTDVENARL